MGMHEGHRERLRKLFLAHGLEGLPEHVVLELLLFYAIPGKDVNPLAHHLVERFGSLNGVLEAGYAELLQVKGVGAGTAFLFSLLQALEKYRREVKPPAGAPVDSAEDAEALLRPHFQGLREEAVYLLCMDAKLQPLSCRLVGHGSLSEATVSIRRVVETALSANAAKVILAHNHTSGIALPSCADVLATKQLQSALTPMGITLMDHLILVENDFVSLRDNGDIR